MSIPVQITTASVPTSFCPSNIATDWPVLIALLSGQINEDVSLFNIGADPPEADDRDKPWIRLDANGRIERIYYYSQGSWLARHPIEPGIISLYEGSLASITTLDGGESATVTEIGGPMWEEVTELRGRFPVGPGTLPVSGDAIAVEETGGNDQINIAIARANLPNFNLEIPFAGNGGVTIDEVTGRFYADDMSFVTTIKSTKAGETLPLGDGDAIETDITPPYYGIYFIRRTARKFYRV